MPVRKSASPKPPPDKSLESWIWDAACSIRGAKDAPKYKDYILPLIFTKRLGLDDVEADIIGKSYEYLIRKFAEGGGQSAGEFYTPPEVGIIMSRVLQPEPGMEVYDPTCGSGGLLVKLETAMEEREGGHSCPPSSKNRGLENPRSRPAPLKLFGQEYTPETWAMANMNMIIHDMEGQIEIGDTFKNPKFRDKRGKLRTFDRVVANPMWNQDWFTEADYDADELGRFPAGAGFPGKSSADWGWVQHIHASLNDKGRAAIVLDTGAASRGSGNGATTGKSYLITDPPDAVFASYLIRVRAGEELEPGFLIQFFQSQGYWQQVDANKHASLKKGVNGSILSEHLIPLPPLPEQKKIAHILSTVQRAIEAQERIIQTTTELKKALMHKLFTEGLRGEPQKQTDIGPVPESWNVCKVGDVAKVQSGGTPTREVAENWSGGTIPWVKTGEINYCVIYDTEEKITPAGLANSAARLFPKGTLVMAMYGQGITRGRVGLLGIEAATNQACAAIRPIDEKRVSSLFLYYYFEYHYKDLRQLGHGANQRNMNAALIRSFPLSFPQPDEQADIVAVLDSLDTKRQLHERKRQQLQDLFRTLLHELMTAKTRVHELDLSV